MFKVSIDRRFKYQGKGLDESLSTDTTESSPTNVEHKKQGKSKLDQFHGDPEKIGRNSNRRKSRNMADAGNEDPQYQQPEEYQEDKTGNENTAAPTEMYLPDLDNTPLSQALKNGFDWGRENEVMIECPKLKQYFGVDMFLIHKSFGRIRLHTKDEDETFLISCSKTKFPIPLLEKSPKESRTTKINPQGSTRRRVVTKNQEHLRQGRIRQETGRICRTGQQVCNKFSFFRACTHGKQRPKRQSL